MSTSTSDPAEVGFDADRLARIDRHFQRYIDDRRLTGWQVAVSRRGQLVHHSTAGHRDRDAEIAWSDDTVVRLFSMTKPITSVAAMMLHEEGAFELKDPVERFIPSFGEARVYRSGSAYNPVTEPLTEPIRMWHLLTHTAGLTYGFHSQHVTDALYRNAGFEWGAPKGLDLAECCDRWAALPLAFQPGSEWNYGVSTDVLGRVVEVISGQSLDEFFRTRIFEPLKMAETGFWVRDDQRDRAARLYSPNPATGEAMISPLELTPTERPTFLSGGGGLWGTAQDYLRFCHFLLNRGELDGVRLLGSRTLDYMTRNHLPGNADLEAFGRPLFAETSFDGVGFGLGFSVSLDPVANRVMSSPGEFAWGGAASTAFWCDPVEDLAVVFLTQLLPSSTHPIRPQLKQLVYQALID
ncbi:MAG: serine hydrolase domain-containing protein [Ilumatobacter sp.]|uniref:serine hydrolase domain-containing protein n=1 Tax=Ilumatobacter sp. TaxID=1967498 RepID=UPI002603BAC7|nr:serine hydrolase domain-containing protein [Ilumatobacter sp.]MDJ0767252.1 serine hydrolase domain-containing protein [Ilumatobacter sp.]